MGIKVTVEMFEKFEEVKNNGGGLENFKAVGLSMGEIEAIVYGYDLLKVLHENGMLEGSEVTANLEKKEE